MAGYLLFGVLITVIKENYCIYTGVYLNNITLDKHNDICGRGSNKYEA